LNARHFLSHICWDSFDKETMLPSAQSSILAGLMVHQQLGGKIPIVTRSSQYTLTTHYDKLIFCALRKHKKEKGLNARHLLSHLSLYARFPQL
jgi:hypothetical protein